MASFGPSCYNHLSVVAYVLDSVFTEHRAPGSHPERPERVEAVRDALKELGLESRGSRVPVRAATEEELGRAHTAGYVAELVKQLPGQNGWLDADTYYCARTWDAVRAAAGAAVDLTQLSLSGEQPMGVAVSRPPGHHAEADRAMGFCLVNNVAVAARSALSNGANKVAIIDWDVHHGNGTQHIFEDDPNVLFVSMHQYPYYPGTGAATERGTGEGLGTTINIPLAAGAGDALYVTAFERVVAPAVRRFCPDLILLSAGFDAFVDDPLAQMRVTHDGYRSLADRLVALAKECCESRLVAVLEGGYDLGGVAGGVVQVVQAMEGAPSSVSFASVKDDGIDALVALHGLETVA